MNAVRLDSSPDEPDWDEVGEILCDAYRQRAPKTLIQLLDASIDQRSVEPRRAR